MTILPFLLQLAALFCLACAAFHWFQTPPRKPDWQALGLFLWLLSLMVGYLQLHPIVGTR